MVTVSADTEWPQKVYNGQGTPLVTKENVPDDALTK